MTLFEGLQFLSVVHEKGFDNIEEISNQFPHKTKEDLFMWKSWLVENKMVQIQVQVKQNKSAKKKGTKDEHLGQQDYKERFKVYVEKIKLWIHEVYPGQNPKYISA